MSTYSIQWACIAELEPAAADDLKRFVIEEAKRVPIEQRMLNNATLAPALLAEAIARWS